MRHKFIGSMMPVVAGLVAAAGIAFAATGHEQQPSRYTVSTLSSLGGKVSRGNSINNGGWVAGYSNLVGDQSRHASLWLYGQQYDLGTLGGSNSTVPYPVKNNIGVVVGIAETNTPDPLGETWSCSFFFPAVTGHTCQGFVWKWGVKNALPTLGGNNGFAAGANNRGQIVGWAENAVHDPTCVAPQVLQFRAVVWEPQRHHIRARELPPLPGDSSGAATAINDRGQAVGISGKCDKSVGRYSAIHAVLWDKGNVIDLGNLGSSAWNTPTAINERGDVAGFAGQPGDDPDNPNQHSFLWTAHGGMRDLGVLPGDLFSQVNGMNNLGQLVGTSCNASGSCRAFLWQNGEMIDLNTLVATGTTGVLTTAQDINDLGVITGRVSDPTGVRLAFVATPVR